MIIGCEDGGNFPLSDASSLLMRLHLEGVDIGDRAAGVYVCLCGPPKNIMSVQSSSYLAEI